MSPLSLRLEALALGSTGFQETTWAAAAAAAATNSLQLRPTLCDPMDCSPPGSAIHGIFQARVLDGLPLPSPTWAEIEVNL